VTKDPKVADYIDSERAKLMAGQGYDGVVHVGEDGSVKQVAVFDSKSIVTAAAGPIRVYHGSAEISRRKQKGIDFKGFDMSIDPAGGKRRPDQGADTLGTWWSASEKDASTFGRYLTKTESGEWEPQQGAVVHADVSINNPKVFHGDEFSKFLNSYRKPNSGISKSPSGLKIRRDLEAQGYDGVHVVGGGKLDNTPDGADWYVTFNDDQHKIDHIDYGGGKFHPGQGFVKSPGVTASVKRIQYPEGKKPWEVMPNQWEDVFGPHAGIPSDFAGAKDQYPYLGVVVPGENDASLYYERNDGRNFHFDIAMKHGLNYGRSIPAFIDNTGKLVYQSNHGAMSRYHQFGQDLERRSKQKAVTARASRRLSAVIANLWRVVTGDMSYKQMKEMLEFKSGKDDNDFPVETERPKGLNPQWTQWVWASQTKPWDMSEDEWEKQAPSAPFEANDPDLPTDYKVAIMFPKTGDIYHARQDRTKTGVNSVFHYNVLNSLPKQHRNRDEYGRNENFLHGYIGSDGQFLFASPGQAYRQFQQFSASDKTTAVRRWRSVR
jgi:hypothetical protein